MHELTTETRAIAEAFAARGTQTYIGEEYGCSYLSVPVTTDEQRGWTVGARFGYVQGAVRIAPSMDTLPPGRYIYVTISHFYQWHDLLTGYPDVAELANRIAYGMMHREAFISFYTSFTLEDVISLQLIVPLRRDEAPVDAALDTLAQLNAVAKAAHRALDEYEEADQ